MEDTKAFVFKVDFDGDLRRFVLADLSYMSLEVKTREVFCFSEEDEIRFLHRDIEGDMITIATEANLLEVYAAIATSPKIIRLYLDVDRIVIGAQKPEVLDEPQKLFAEHEKLGRTPEPQDESAEPEGTTSARTSSSASSTPQGRPTCFERKQRALSRLASRRRRLMQRHQNLIEKCDRLEERATVVTERLNNVDRRILDTLNACPELAAFFPELDLEGVVAGPESDRSRSNLFCDSCDIGILAYSEVHFHCEACGNFDLCVRCERQFGHEHALVRIEPGTRRLPSFFDLSFDDEVRTLEACCLDVWHELEASGLMCPRNLAILAIISLLSFVMALTTAYALCSAIFSVATP